MAVIIYHNSRCTKSREALEILRTENIPHEVRFYLEDPLNETEIRALLKKLQVPAVDLVRKNEEIYKEQFKGRELSEEEWIAALAKFPRLIERPVVVNGNRAVIARPPERVHEIL